MDASQTPSTKTRAKQAESPASKAFDGRLGRARSAGGARRRGPALDPHNVIDLQLFFFSALLLIVSVPVVEGAVEIMGGMSKGRLFATFFSLASVAVGIAVQV